MSMVEDRYKNVPDFSVQNVFGKKAILIIISTKNTSPMD